MTNTAVVHFTASSYEEAHKIIDTLLNAKLVACAQTTEIESRYVWDNKINKRKEISTHLKCKKNDFPNIEKVILDNHSYEVPEIILLNIDNGHLPYLNWIEEVTDEK